MSHMLREIVFLSIYMFECNTYTRKEGLSIQMYHKYFSVCYSYSSWKDCLKCYSADRRILNSLLMHIPISALLIVTVQIEAINYKELVNKQLNLSFQTAVYVSCKISQPFEIVVETEQDKQTINAFLKNVGARAITTHRYSKKMFAFVLELIEKALRIATGNLIQWQPERCESAYMLHRIIKLYYQYFTYLRVYVQC